jgi:DNA-binding NarL/FixJ family response regulator
MPTVDGLEVLRRLRAGGDEVPVVFFSAEHDRGLIERAHELGAFAFLVKGCDPAKIGVTLSHAARMTRAA